MKVEKSKTATSTDEVMVRAYDIDEVEKIEPRFPNLTPRGKLRCLSYFTPSYEDKTENTTCVELDELRSRSLNQSLSVSDTADRMEIGTGDDEPQYQNRELNEYQDDIDIVEYNSDGTTLILNGFLASDLLVGLNLVEMNVITESGRQLIHALYQEFEKVQGQGVVYQATIFFEPKED